MDRTEPKETTASCIKMQGTDLGVEGISDEPLLKGVTWEVRPAEFWVVGGMHRSGKSTLLETLAMLQKPLSGKIEVFGKDPWTADEANLIKQRLKIGLVFESGARLLHNLTLAENTALPLCYHKDCRMEEARGRVDELLEFAGVTSMARQLPGNLTRTYRQRASLARALSLSPEMLLLDNPLSGVDLSERTWWQETVMSLWQGHKIVDGKPMTIVIATNHLAPWIAKDRQFALLHGKAWQSLGGMNELQNSQEPLLRNVLGQT